MFHPFPTLFLLSVGVLSIGVAMGAESHKTVPTHFQGEWNANVAHCGTPRDDSRLRITQDRIHFAESSGAIKAVVTRGDRELAIITELSGEGSTWLSYNHFRLSADQKSLKDVTNEEAGQKAGLVRYRCPKTAK